MRRRWEKIIKAKIPFFRKNESKAEALGFYRDEEYKLEMINDLEDGTISLYTQGDFTGLCRGPHIPIPAIDCHTNNFTALSVVGVLQYAFLPLALCQILKSGYYLTIYILRLSNF